MAAVALVAMVLLFHGGRGCGNGARDDMPPPSFVLVISLDTLRADHLPCYGYERDTAPTISALARESVVFEQAFSQSAQTLTSHKSLFASKYPLTLVAQETNADLETLATLETPLEFTVDCFGTMRETLVSALHEAGYTTAAFTDGGYVHEKVGFGEGYDLFNDDAGGFAQVLTRAGEWLNGHDLAEPTFLFVHGYDIHCPYWSREPFNTRYLEGVSSELPFEHTCGKGTFMEVELSDEDVAAINAHYDGGIASVDDYLAKLFDHLRELGVYDEALIVILSDHGESLGEHGQVGHGGLYLEQLHVPLILKLPASWDVQPARLAEPVELVDVMPTILECCDVPVPEDGLDGRSLLSILFRGGEGRRYVVAQTTFQEGRRPPGGPTVYQSSASKRSLLEPGRWHLVHDPRGGAVELFELGMDPGGTEDLAPLGPDMLPDLLEVLEGYDRGDPGAGFRPPETLDLPEEVRERLRDIGYGGDK